MKNTIIILIALLMVGFVSGKNVKSINYKFNSKDIEYDDGSHQLIIGGQQYADSKGALIEEASSLIDCEYCSNINYLALDPLFPVTVHNINWTHINFTVYVSEYYKNKNIPITIYNRSDETKIIFSDEVRLKNKYDGKTFFLPLGMMYKIKWGINSTTIRINVSAANTGRIRDDFSAGCTGLGDDTILSDTYSIIGNYNIINGFESRSFLDFNTSILDDDVIINSVNLYMYLNITNGLQVGDNTSVYQCNYGTLDNTDFESTWGTQEGKIWDDNSALDVFHNLSLNTSYINKTGFTKYCLKSNFDCVSEDRHWRGSELDTTKNTYLNISYSLGCPYTAIDCSTTTLIDTACDNAGNDIIITGAGTLRMDADIYNTGNITIHDCNVDCYGGCFV